MTLQISGRLVALVVTHNRLDHLRKTLARLLQTPPPLLDSVIVVDSGSTDGTRDWLAAQHDTRLIVRRSDSNIGGAGGFEMGLRHARKHLDFDWIVLMDDDGRPDAGALHAFHAQDPAGWDALAAAVYYPSGAICDMNRPVKNPFWSSRLLLRTLLGGGSAVFHLAARDYLGDVQRVDLASFVGLFLRRDIIDRIGFPDGSLFIYGEDALYTLDLSRGGGRIGFCPKIRFEHDCSTFVAGSRRVNPLWKNYYYHRNLLVLYRQAAGWLFWPTLLIILPKWLIGTVNHPGARWQFLRLLSRAIRDGFARRTGTDHAALLAEVDPPPAPRASIARHIAARAAHPNQAEGQQVN